MIKKIIKIVPLLLILFLLFSKLIIPHYMTRDGLCVLGYHGVVSDEEKRNQYAHNRYVLSVSQFEQQLQYLADQGYRTYSMEEVLLYYQGQLTVEPKAVVLTFDDGLKNFNTVVKPLIEKYQFQATCFVIGKHLVDDQDEFLKLGDINPTAFVSYYSHSYDLHRLSNQGFNRKIIQDLSLDEIADDFEKDLSDHRFFAFPYGRTVPGIASLLHDQGVQLAFSYNQFRHLTMADNRYDLPRYMMVDILPTCYFKWIIE